MISFSFRKPKQFDVKAPFPWQEILRSQFTLEHIKTFLTGSIPLTQATLQRGVIDQVNQKLNDSRYEITDITCEPKGIRMGLRARGPIRLHTTYKFYLIFSEFTLTPDVQRIHIKISGAGKGPIKEITNFVVQVIKLIIETLLEMTMLSNASSNYLNSLNPTEIEIDLMAIEGWQKVTRIKWLDKSVFEWIPFNHVAHLHQGVQLQGDTHNWAIYKAYQQQIKPLLKQLPVIGSRFR